VDRPELDGAHHRATGALHTLSPSIATTLMADEEHAERV
jgi:hypothetical protein